MTTASTYPVRFASPRRDSALPGLTSAAGKVTWSREVSKPSSADWPPTVLTWDDRLVVATPADMDVFDSQGNRLWARPKQAGTPSAVSQGLLYYKDKSRFLEAMDAAGVKVLAEAPFPGATRKDVMVDLFWPREHDFVAVLREPGDSEVAEGDPPDTPLAQPAVVVMKNRYPITYGDWDLRYQGRPRLAPLFSPERGVVAFLLAEVIRVDVVAETELSRFKAPLDTLVEWSADADEVYCFTGYQADGAGRRKALSALSATGEELWRWTDPDDSDEWAVRQPPIRAPGGHVFVLTRGRVLAIDSGTLRWQYDTLSDSLKHGAHVDSGTFELREGRLMATGSLRHGSVLADGSLLVTGNKTLHHLSAEGRKIFSVSVDGDILSPPVVDADGHIYVATATHLIRID